MTDLIWSPRSVADLEEIRGFIAADSPAWADLVEIVTVFRGSRLFPAIEP